MVKVYWVYRKGFMILGVTRPNAIDTTGRRKNGVCWCTSKTGVWEGFGEKQGAVPSIDGVCRWTNGQHHRFLKSDVPFEKL